MATALCEQRFRSRPMGGVLGGWSEWAAFTEVTMNRGGQVRVDGVVYDLTHELEFEALIPDCKPGSW